MVDYSVGECLSPPGLGGVVSRESLAGKLSRGHESERDERLFELFAWVQEHANLCRVFSCCNRADVETFNRLCDAVDASGRRGSGLVEVLSDHFAKCDSLEHPAIPLSAFPRVLQPVQLPRVSGSQRFAERQGSAKLALSGLAGQEPPKELLPSRDYTKNPRGKGSV
jgi:hypothetical protein